MEQWSYESARDHGLSPSDRLRSVRREGGLVSAAARYTWWKGVRGYLALYHRLDIHGRANLPESPPFVIVANHCSHLDVMCIAAALPPRLRARAYPLAAGDTFFRRPGPAIFAATALNALPVWRDRARRHAMQDLRDRLIAEQCIFILFPEGTRTRDGAMQRFKPGVGMIVAGTEVPVVPCHLAGAFESLPPGARLPRPRSVSVSIAAPLSFADVANQRRGWELIGTTLESAVAASRRTGPEP